jgi:hypothetical protein
MYRFPWQLPRHLVLNSQRFRAMLAFPPKGNRVFFYLLKFNLISEDIIFIIIIIINMEYLIEL